MPLLKTRYKTTLSAVKMTALLLKIKNLAAGNSRRFVLDRGYDRFRGDAISSFTIDESLATATILLNAGGRFGVSAASVTIQNLTYTAKKAGEWFANDARITYIDPGADGSLSIEMRSHDIIVTLAYATGAVTSTAAEIKAAIEANAAANAIVSIAVIDDSNLPQDAQGSTALAGGTDLTAASKVIQDLTYTADTGGAAGNAITIEYTGGATAGSEVVTVVDNAISVQIEDGVSTATEVKTAVDAKAEAAALVDVVISGTAGDPQDVAAAVNLEGGTDLVAATKEIQNLNYTADTPGTAGNSITLTYTDDGTAGSETVDVVGNDIEVHMEDGVSTAAQIKTAVDASGPAAALVDVAVDAGGDTVQDAKAQTGLTGGSNEQSYDKADVLKIRRLRTKKWLVIVDASANPA